MICAATNDAVHSPDFHHRGSARPTTRHAQRVELDRVLESALQGDTSKYPTGMILRIWVPSPRLQRLDPVDLLSVQFAYRGSRALYR